MRCVARRVQSMESLPGCTFSLEPCVCWLPRGTFACWCAAAFLRKAHRAASLADVLRAVYCGRIFSPRALKPPTEIAFDSGAWEASIPGFIQHELVFDSHHTSADFADFLASPSPLHKCIQGKVDATCTHKS